MPKALEDWEKALLFASVFDRNRLAWADVKIERIFAELMGWDEERVYLAFWVAEEKGMIERVKD